MNKITDEVANQKTAHGRFFGFKKKRPAGMVVYCTPVERRVFAQRFIPLWLGGGALPSPDAAVVVEDEAQPRIEERILGAVAVVLLESKDEVIGLGLQAAHELSNQGLHRYPHLREVAKCLRIGPRSDP